MSTISLRKTHDDLGTRTPDNQRRPGSEILLRDGDHVTDEHFESLSARRSGSELVQVAIGCTVQTVHFDHDREEHAGGQEGSRVRYRRQIVFAILMFAFAVRCRCAVGEHEIDTD